MSGELGYRLLRRAIRIERHEVAATLWSAAYMFCLLCAYYILRAVRDEIGSQNFDRLPSYWTTTFFVVLVLVPIYAAASSRWPRRVFIGVANRFFNANLVILFVLLHVLEGSARDHAEWVFYVWLSGFVMFVLTVMWGFMSDVFTSEQGKRLFGFIAVGGSLGGIVGPAVTSLVVEWTGQINLFLISIALLELACVCVARIDAVAPRASDRKVAQEIAQQPVPGGVLHGMIAVFRNPYLLAVAVFFFLFTYGSTVLYFEKAQLAHSFIADRDVRTAFYARVDLAVNSLSAVTQGLVVGRLLPRLGVARVLVIVPALTVLGFTALAIWPVFGVVIGFEILRRSGEFGLGRPSREVLFTVVSREERYKSKAFLDTVVYRGSDMVNGWIHEALTSTLGLGLAALAWIAVPVSAVWIALAHALGTSQQRRARAESP